MGIKMKQAFLASIVASLIAPLSAYADQITLLDSDDYVWQTTPEGVAFSALQGDRFVEPYHALVRLPAGTISPPHVRSANMFGVMLQGEMIRYADGEDPEIGQSNRTRLVLQHFTWFGAYLCMRVR